MTNSQLFQESPIAACYNWQPPANPVITEQDVINKVSYLTGITFFEMQHKTRLREVVIARQISMYLICKYTRLSLKVIGNMFGGRDHTTVIHSRATVCDLMESDPMYYNRVKEIEDSLLTTGTPQVFRKRRESFEVTYENPVIKPIVRFIDKYSNVK